MTAHIIAHAWHQTITTASLLELRDALRLARRTGSTDTVHALRREINRRFSI